MVARAGKTFVAEYLDGEVWTVIPGQRGTVGAVAHEYPDVTEKGDDWSVNEFVGSSRATITVNGVVRQDDGETIFKTMMAKATLGELVGVRLVSTTGTWFGMLAKITTVSREGNYNDAEMYGLTFESAGALTEPAPPVPVGDPVAWLIEEWGAGIGLVNIRLNPVKIVPAWSRPPTVAVHFLQSVIPTGVEIDTGSSAVHKYQFPPTHRPVTGGGGTNRHIAVSPTGRIYVWNNSGRYVAWSDDGGDTWAEHDYGGNFTTAISTLVSAKDSNGVSYMWINRNDGFIYRATFATPPVLSTVAGLTSNNAPNVCNGDIVLHGSDGAGFAGSVARMVSGAFVASRIVNLLINGCFRTAAGTYLARFFTSVDAKIYRSINFSSWSLVCTFTATSGTIGSMIQMASGRIVASNVGSTSGAVQRKLIYSDDDGASWNDCTVPILATSTNMGAPMQGTNPNRLVCVLSTNNECLVSTDGITWTLSPTDDVVGYATIQSAYGQMVTE
jgi:predicted secreted protein